MNSETKLCHDRYMAGHKASGGRTAELKCPHCKGTHEVPSIPNTDSMAICPDCDELFMKVIDGRGKAHACVPGVSA